MPLWNNRESDRTTGINGEKKPESTVRGSIAAPAEIAHPPHPQPSARTSSVEWLRSMVVCRRRGRPVRLVRGGQTTHVLVAATELVERAPSARVLVRRRRAAKSLRGRRHRGTVVEGYLSRCGTGVKGPRRPLAIRRRSVVAGDTYWSRAADARFGHPWPRRDTRRNEVRINSNKKKKLNNVRKHIRPWLRRPWLWLRRRRRRRPPSPRTALFLLFRKSPRYSVTRPARYNCLKTILDDTTLVRDTLFSVGRVDTRSDRHDCRPSVSLGLTAVAGRRATDSGRWPAPALETLFRLQRVSDVSVR